MIRSFVAFLSLVSIDLGASSCQTFRSADARDSSRSRAGDVVGCVERVLVDATVEKELARDALAALEALARTDFHGDALAAQGDLLQAIERSEEQTQALRSSIDGLRGSAAEFFEAWSAELENVGNAKQRQRSESRLEECRARHEAVVTAAISAHIACDAFDSEMRDAALSLGQDLDAAAVSGIAADVRVLTERSRELDRRLAACCEAARAFLEAAAPHGQLDAPAAATAAGEQGR